MENTDEKIADEILENIRHGDAEAVRKLEELAANGNARAMSNLATVFFKGLGGVESSYKKAAELFEKAAALDEVFALATLGRFYRDSKCGFEQNGHKAAEFFVRAAKLAVPKGAAMCLRSAAEIYHYGQSGVAPEGRKAVALYEKLADLESRGEVEITFSRNKALFRIADIYANGCGNLAPNAKKAVEYLNKAAERGDERSALYELAEFYREGKAGLKPDGYKVIEYLARLGDFKGIAEIYRDGKYNVQADGRKAVKYLTKEIARDKGKTLNEIADWYLKSGKDDMNDANEYCGFLEEIYNIYTFTDLGKIYLEGKGDIQPDGATALEYFLKADAGIDEAVSFTKKFFERNSDIARERTGAFNLISRWGKLLKRNVSLKIAGIYKDGLGGVPVKGPKALEYFLTADECGDEWAFFQVAKIYREGKGNLKPDGVKLIEFLAKKMAQDETLAKNILCDIAEAYEEGCGSLEPNMTKALEFYRKAATLGNDDAKRKLVELTGANQ